MRETQGQQPRVHHNTSSRNGIRIYLSYQAAIYIQPGSKSIGYSLFTRKGAGAAIDDTAELSPVKVNEVEWEHGLG